jgi:hypothetical protein
MRAVGAVVQVVVVQVGGLLDMGVNQEGVLEQGVRPVLAVALERIAIPPDVGAADEPRPMADCGGTHVGQVAVNVERTSELLCGEADRREGLEDDVLVHAHILPAVGVEEELVVVEVADPVVVEVDVAPAEIQVVGVVKLAVVDGGAGVDVTGKEQAAHGLLAEVVLDRHAILNERELRLPVAAEVPARLPPVEFTVQEGVPVLVPVRTPYVEAKKRT